MTQEKIILDVKVIAGARKTMIKEEGALLKVYLNTPPIDGRANKALIELLSEHFGVSKSSIEITKGLQSRHKTISIYKNFANNFKERKYARRTN